MVTIYEFAIFYKIVCMLNEENTQKSESIHVRLKLQIQNFPFLLVFQALHLRVYNRNLYK